MSEIEKLARAVHARVLPDLEAAFIEAVKALERIADWRTPDAARREIAQAALEKIR